MLPTRLADLKTSTRNTLLLESAFRTVTALSAEQQEAMRATYEAGLRRASVADQLADEQSGVASMILYREAFPLLAKAVVLLHDPDGHITPTTGPVGLTALGALAERGRIPALPRSLAEAEEILGPGKPGAFDAWTTDQLLAKRQVAGAAVRFLRKLVEPRTTRELKNSRLSRITVTAVAALAALTGFGWLLLRAPNLALNKPVAISERLANSAGPPDNTGLTNGRIDSPYGIHTALGGGWVMVDLQGVYRISQVKVYNRADGFLLDSLPLFLEFSVDGKDFVQKKQCSENFTARSPWVYDAAGARARYVRIRSNQYVALSELEVYGKR